MMKLDRDIILISNNILEREDIESLQVFDRGLYDIKIVTPTGGVWGKSELISEVLDSLYIKRERERVYLLNYCETFSPENWDKFLIILEGEREFKFIFVTSDLDMIPSTIRGRVSEISYAGEGVSQFGGKIDSHLRENIVLYERFNNFMEGIDRKISRPGYFAYEGVAIYDEMATSMKKSGNFTDEEVLKFKRSYLLKIYSARVAYAKKTGNLPLLRKLELGNVDIRANIRYNTRSEAVIYAILNEF